MDGPIGVGWGWWMVGEVVVGDRKSTADRQMQTYAYLHPSNNQHCSALFLSPSHS
jgi:hypothetical protein